MKDSTNSAVDNLALALPELSLEVISILEIAIYIGLASLVYYLGRKLVLVVSSSGAIEKRTLYHQFLNCLTFVLPTLIFLYGLTNVSRDSLFVSLLFFVIFSIVFGFSLVQPFKSLFTTLLITVRGDLKIGDYVSFEKQEGEIIAIGAFNVVLQSKNGGRSFIPTHQILEVPYEVHAKKGGPSIIISVPSESISKRNLERLAHLCPFKRPGSDIRISSQEDEFKVSIEIIGREARPWVIKYFERHYQ